MSKTVQACPACDSTQVYRRRSDRFTDSERYRCGACADVFPTPVERTAHSTNPDGNIPGVTKRKERIVTEALATFHKNGVSWVKTKRLAEKCDLSPRQIGATMGSLQESGVVESWTNTTTNTGTWRLIRDGGETRE